MKKIALALLVSLSVFANDVNVKLKVTGMTCPSCVKNVKNAISNVKGVKDAKVYLKDGKADVTCESTTKASDIVDAIKKDGYGAEIVK